MTQKIFTQIGDERIELTGQALEDFIFDREEMRQAAEIKKLEAEAKVAAKASAQAKLAALGLTVEDLQALGL